MIKNLLAGPLSLVLSVICYGCTTPHKSYDDFLLDLHAKGRFNGNALILENGEITYQKALGFVAADAEESLTLNSAFRLASVSKQFTAMCIMILKERGQLRYEDELTDFIPELPYQGITIRHLLQHTSGLPDYMTVMNAHWKNDLASDDPKRFIGGNDDIIDMFSKQQTPVSFSPGMQWEYSNTGYMLLASIVRRVSGLPFEQFAQENIFDALGMTSTLVYDYKPGKDPDYSDRVFGFYADAQGKLQENDCHYLHPARGDGGVFSTLADLLKWDRALYTEKLITKATLEEAFTAGVLNDGEKTPYGYGWFVGENKSGKVVFHGGSWVGFRTYIYRELETNTCIILLANNSVSQIQDIVNGLREIKDRQ